MKDSKHKYKILMLSDLRKSTSSTLKSAISLAKIINGDIEFFCVRKPTEIIEKDNQLSAIREINKNYIATETKIKKLIKTVSDSHGVNVNYKLVYGNVKGEIDNYISEYQPVDILKYSCLFHLSRYHKLIYNSHLRRDYLIPFLLTF